MTEKMELLELTKTLLEKMKIRYHHAVVSEERGLYVLSVRCSSQEQKNVVQIFLDMNNFSCSSTSSYKKNACQKIHTFFKYSWDIPNAIDHLRTKINALN